MINRVLTITLGLLLMGPSVFAEDVRIDLNGNFQLGATGLDGKLEVLGENNRHGVIGESTGTGIGIYGINSTNSGGGYAGYFDGDTRVTGDLIIDGSLIGGSAGGGDVSAVNAGPGLTGGGTSGEITLNADTTYLQRLVSGTCIGQVVVGINPDGTVACETDDNTHISEATVENYVTNGAIDLSSGSTIGGVGIAGVNHTHPASGSIGNVAFVAQSGGDYISPITAMSDIASWCGTPSASNRCLLKIMPGIYNVSPGSLNMQSYVDIEGSGENVTIITGSLDSASAGIVNGANNAELSFLTIENTSTHIFVTAVYNENVSVEINKVTAVVTGGTIGRGFCNLSSNVVMNDIKATVSGAAFGEGIYNISSPLTIRDATIDASGLTQGIGITAITEYGEGPVEIMNSKIKGSDASISTGVRTLVANTILDGMVGAPPSTVTCAGAYNTNYMPAICP